MSITCSNCSHVNGNAKAGDICQSCSQVLGVSSATASNLDWTWKIRTIRLQSCEGTVVHIEELRDREEPDPDMPGILTKILLFLDVFLVLGSFGLVLFGAGMICVVIGLIFSIGCILPVLAMIGNVLIFSFIKTLMSIIGRRPETVSVAKYEVLTPSGTSVSVKIKGNLQGGSLRENDRVKLWGKEKNKVLLFRCGVNTISGVPYLSKESHSAIWLGLLVFLNLVFIIWILLSMANTAGGA